MFTQVACDLQGVIEPSQTADVHRSSLEFTLKKRVTIGNAAEAEEDSVIILEGYAMREPCLAVTFLSLCPFWSYLYMLVTLYVSPPLRHAVLFGVPVCWYDGLLV